jgi:hypothetical protein
MRALAAAVAATVAASACGGSAACDGNCPAVADDYAVQTSTLDQACGFTPWLVPPTLTLAQTSAGNRVTLSVIDPANQVSVGLLADLRVPDSGQAIAVFEGLLRTQRQSSLGSADLLTVQIVLDGSITISEGRRFLELALLSWQLEEACVSTQVVTAMGSPVSLR